MAGCEMGASLCLRENLGTSVVGLRGISGVLPSPLPLYEVAPRGGNMVQGRDTRVDPGSRLGFATSSLTWSNL